MKYVPHATAFTFFALLGLSIAGIFPFLMFVRAIGAMICLAVCILIAEKAATKKTAKPPVDMKWRYITAVAQSALKKGDVCTVDALYRTIERASS